MKNDWIIDVLMDLKKFSANNKLENLAEQLDDTIMVATSDLSLPDMSLRRMVGDFDQSAGNARTPFAGENA